MKVNGIELLQMIKAGKVPYNTRIEVSGGTHLHYPYVVLYGSNKLYWEYENISSAVLTNELLEYYFEIPKPTAQIEKLSEYAFEDKMKGIAKGWTQNETILKDKINELIIEINKIKGSK